MRGLLGPHMFIGLMLIPPIALKLASTGYRFVRYYTGAPVYVAKGPPQLALRVLAPVLVATTVMIFVTGVWLLLLGHRSDQVLMLHKVAFIVWSGVFGVHFLAYLPRAGRSLRAAWATAPRRPRTPGRGGHGGCSSRRRSAPGSCSRSRCSRTSAPGTATTASESADGEPARQSAPRRRPRGGHSGRTPGPGHAATTSPRAARATLHPPHAIHAGPTRCGSRSPAPAA